MNFLSNVYNSLTSVCRKERPLNGKRAYPFDEQEKTIKKSSKTNSRENSISSKSIARIQEEHNNMQIAIFAEEFPANQSAIHEEIVIDYQNTGLENNQILIKGDSMEAIIEANNNEDKFEVSTEDLSSMGEKKLSSASEDSDDDEELEEKKPYKKIKLNSVPAMEAEEKQITEGWNYNFKSLRKYLGRMNRLFEITQGYKEKRDPLVISPEKVVEAEPMLIEQEGIEIEQQTLPVEQGTLEIEQEDHFDQENAPNFGNQNHDLIESFNPQQMKSEKPSSKKKVVVNPPNQMRRLSSQDFTVAMPVFQATLEV